MPMPEFKMPPEAVAPPVAGGPPPASRPDDDPVDGPTATPDAAVRTRVPWRLVVSAGMVGALTGAALTIAVQAADRAAAEVQLEALRTSATAYLTALADGEADLATSMVPVLGDRSALDALRTAERLHDFEVRWVTVADDTALIGVHYEVGSMDEERVLDAERVDGSWRLMTSLAEPSSLHFDAGGPRMSIGGVQLSGYGPVQLYPGRYTIDAGETALFRYGGGRMDVDGDPATPAELYASAEPTEDFRRAVLAVADRSIEACKQQPDCPFAADAVLTRDGPSITAMDLRRRAIDVAVQIGAAHGLRDEWHELHVRALIDGAGELASWECAPIGAPDAAMQPCAP